MVRETANLQKMSTESSGILGYLAPHPSALVLSVAHHHYGINNSSLLQGEELAGPEGWEKAQEGREQQVHHQGNPVKVGWATPDQWEDSIKGSTGDP